MNKPKISVVLGSYNRKWLLKLAIQSVRENGITIPYEIIVVDGGSTDGSMAWLIEQPDIITIVQHNREVVNGQFKSRRSWGYFMNLGFKAAQGKYVLMISDDCILHDGAVVSGYRAMEQGEENVAACAFYFRDYPVETQYKVYAAFGGRISVNHGLYRRNAMEKVGWLEEERYQFYHADTDFCLKLWEAGYQIVACPAALVEHYMGKNDKVRKSNYRTAKQNQDWQRYLERWEGIYDPASPQYGWHYLPQEASDHVAKAFDQYRPWNWQEQMQLARQTVKRHLPSPLLDAIRGLNHAKKIV